MSLYNMLCGVNPAAGALLALLGLDHHNVPRFRDIYLRESEGGDPEIVLYTRTGGGNRGDYVAENQSLRKIPGFIGDWDDDFDSTFAHWAYRVPEEVREPLQKGFGTAATVTPREKFNAALDAIKKGG